MQTCNRCHTKLKDNTGFCPVCGADVREDEKKKGGKNPKVKMGVAGLVMVLIAVCLMKFGFGTNSINAEDYVTVTVEGTNGQAVAEAEVDDRKLEKDILTKTGFVKRYGSMEEIEDALEILDGATNKDLRELGLDKDQIKTLKTIQAITKGNILSVKLSKTENIKNGDAITVTYIYDNDKNAENDFRIKGNKTVMKIQGLKER